LVQLHIAPGSVHASLLAGWLRPQVVARSKRLLGLEGEPPPVPEDMHQIGPQLTNNIDSVLSELLSTVPGQQPRLSVALDTSWVHLDVVTGTFADASDRHLQSIANACVAEVLGEAATTQVIRCHLQPDRQHLLIAAISQRDLDAVAAVADRHRLKLTSVAPDFCRHWAQYAGSCVEGSGVFACTSAARAVVAYVLNGSIVALSCGNAQVRAEHGESDLASALDARVNRLLARIGQDARAVANFVWVVSRSAVPQANPPSARWKVHQLTLEAT
jgi:hypothetical protein